MFNFDFLDKKYIYRTILIYILMYIIYIYILSRKSRSNIKILRGKDFLQ